MPPTSRGFLLLRTSHSATPLQPRLNQLRHVSFKRPTNIPESLRPPPPKSPPLSPPRAAAPAGAPPKTPRWSKRLYLRLRRNHYFRTALLVLPWLPIAAVAIHHFPLTHRSIEGPSMQPTFNPDHTDELGELNKKTQAIILKQNMTPTWFSDKMQWLFPSSSSKKTDSTIQRGQIVAYRTPHNPERIGVKRVVGIPGDRVTPVPEYPGHEHAVIVPFNHLWLEGDIGDLKKSVDSNTYGPVSANLVTGIVKGAWQFVPSFPPIRIVRWDESRYPAQNRVEKDVVRQYDPNEVERRRSFLDGTAAQSLSIFKQEYPLDRQLTALDRKQMERLLRAARQEMEQKDVETYELACELEAELRAKLFAKVVKTKLKNVEMSKEEFQAMQRDKVVPESVLARSHVSGT